MTNLDLRAASLLIHFAEVNRNFRLMALYRPIVVRYFNKYGRKPSAWSPATQLQFASEIERATSIENL